jgi:integrase/recombinase XerC/integrase/recombinase XerD
MIEILSDDEIGRIVQSINPDSFLGARLYAIVLVLLDTGIRASELCTLTMDNTFLTEGFLKVRGKGNKERMVPFGALTKKALLKYLHSYRPEAQSDDQRELFLSIEGTPLSYNGLALLIRRLGSNSDVPRLHPHLFRHTFAVRYLMNGGDIMTLRLILGHTTLEVTQMYMHRYSTTSSHRWIGWISANGGAAANRWVTTPARAVDANQSPAAKVVCAY